MTPHQILRRALADIRPHPMPLTDHLRAWRQRRAIVRVAGRLTHLPGPRGDLTAQHLGAALDELSRRVDDLAELVDSRLPKTRWAVTQLVGQCLLDAMRRPDLPADQSQWLLHRLGEAYAAGYMPHADTDELVELLAPGVLSHRDVLAVLDGMLSTRLADAQRLVADHPASMRALAAAHPHLPITEDLLVRFERMSEAEAETFLAMLPDWQGPVARLLDAADVLADGRMTTV